MATSSRSTERFKYGICLNDECSLCKEKKVQQIPMRKDLVCSECGKPLRECPPPKKKGMDSRLIGIIAAILLVLAGAGFGIYSFMGGTKIDKIVLDKDTVSIIVGQNDVIKASIVDKNGKEIKDIDVTFVWTIDDEKVASVTQGGEVAALKEGKTSITVKVADDEKLFAICQVEVKDTIPVESTSPEASSSETKTEKEVKPIGPQPPMPKVSWGKYEGPANGLGGTIKVTRDYSLDLHNDGEPLQLSPGDEIQQTKFNDGELRGGVWVHNGSRRYFTR